MQVLSTSLAARRGQYQNEMGDAQTEFLERLKGLTDQVQLDQNNVMINSNTSLNTGLLDAQASRPH